MRGEDAVDDKVGRGVDEDEQVRDRVQRDEQERRAIFAAHAHAVPYVVGTEEGLEVKYVLRGSERDKYLSALINLKVAMETREASYRE